MSVHELSRDQIIQLKESYLCETMDCVSYGELANADSLVSDSVIFAEYGGFSFVPEDFW